MTIESAKKHSDHTCHFTKTEIIYLAFDLEKEGEHKEEIVAETSNLTALSRCKNKNETSIEEHNEPHKLCPTDHYDLSDATYPKLEGMVIPDLTTHTFLVVFPDPHLKEHEKGSVSHINGATTTEKRVDPALDHPSPAKGTADLVDSNSNTSCEIS